MMSSNRSAVCREAPNAAEARSGVHIRSAVDRQRQSTLTTFVSLRADNMLPFGRQRRQTLHGGTTSRLLTIVY
jgi:hypothetical protein